VFQPNGISTEFVELAKIPDCLHMAPVHSKHKSILQADDPYKPLSTFGRLAFEAGLNYSKR
jgi:hypothetical protein